MPIINRFEIRRARLTPVVVANDLWLFPEVLVATEVSPRGLFVATDEVAQPEGSVRVSFRLGTPELWEFDARVAHSRSQRRLTDPDYSGFGLELVDARPVDRLRMRQLLRGVPPPLPRTCRAARVADRQDDRRGNRRGGGRRKTDPPKHHSRWGKGRLTHAICAPIVASPRRLLRWFV